MFLLLPLSCLADGIVIPATALPAEVHIPDQRALIHFTNGIERLVIETRFTGAGTNFAWIVPLPSPPVIEEATTGLFPTLQYLFQPRIAHDVPRYFAWFLLAIALGYFLWFAPRGSRLRVSDIFACLVVAAALGFLEGSDFSLITEVLAFLVLIYASSRVRSSAWGLLEGLLIAGLVLILAGLFLPALATAGASATQASEVSIIDRKMVGIYETTTIVSHDATALQSWLQANGYAPPVHGDDIIASYVKQGWVFVAAKVRRDDPSLQTGTPQPLSFTFKTDRAVYPMRLTGIDGRPLRVELYVFGPDRAETPHFKVESCAIPVYPPDPELSRNQPGYHPGYRRWSESPAISHPLLRSWICWTPVATKLSATLTPENMRDDIWLSWKPFSPAETVLYSDHGAWVTGANWGMPLIAIGVVVTALWRKILGKWPRRLLSRSVIAGAIVTGVIYFTLPKVGVRMVWMPGMRNEQSLYEIKRAAEQVVAHGKTNLARIRLELVKTIGVMREPSGENYLLGGRIHEEDSPGNYRLRETTNGLEFITYDANGAPGSDFFGMNLPGGIGPRP